MADQPKIVAESLLVRREFQRLGKNIRGYLGETVNIGEILAGCYEAAEKHGWSREELRTTSGLRLPAFTRRHKPQNAGAGNSSSSSRRVYISTGIHGDEPAGPLAVRQLLEENQWPDAFDLWLCPCLNPAGFESNRRENPDGLDLNRDYLSPKAPETIAHIGWLERQPSFDLCLCLHEDWEAHGFYVYELNPEDRPSLAPGMVARVAEVCPIDLSEVIEGRAAEKGIIRPGLSPLERPQWPEAFYLLTYKTRLSYTLEAPSDFPLAPRVAALVTGVRAALELAPC